MASGFKRRVLITADAERGCQLGENVHSKPATVTERSAGLLFSDCYRSGIFRCHYRIPQAGHEKAHPGEEKVLKEIVPQSDKHKSVDHAKRGEEIIEYVSLGLSLATGGLSEAVSAPLRRLIKKRLEIMEEALVTDIRNGLISSEDVIDEERLASFILRVRRGAIEGVGRRKIRLMARIFFKDAAKDEFQEDLVGDFWLVTEQLNPGDMKALAVLKKAQNEGYFDEPKIKDEPTGPLKRSLIPELDQSGLFRLLTTFRKRFHHFGDLVSLREPPRTAA